MLFACLFPDKIIATETGAHALLSEALVSLVRPLIRSMFVGKYLTFPIGN